MDRERHYRSRHSGERRRRVRVDYDDYPQSRDSQSQREMIDNERGSSRSKEKHRVKGQDRDHEQWERSKEHDREEVYLERHHTRKRLRGDDDYRDPGFERFGDREWERKRDRGDYDYHGSCDPDFDRRRDYEQKSLPHMIQACETLEAVTVSNLPTHLLTKILSNLPTPQYIGTSLVTPQWKNLWKTYPTMDLQASEFQTYENFKKFVVGFLQSLAGFDIEKFRLVGLNNIEESLETWIRYAVGGRVRQLAIENFSTYSLPRCLFRSSTLVTLSLAYPQLVEEDSTFSLPSLKNLKLARPSPPTSNKAVEVLIKSCINLVELDMKLCKTEGSRLSHVHIVSKTMTVLKLYFARKVINDMTGQSTEIDAPRLSFFKIAGHNSGRFRLIQKPPGLTAHVDIVLSNNLLSEISFCRELVVSRRNFPEVMLYLGNRATPPFTNLLRLKLLHFQICDIPVLQITSRAPNLELITLDSTAAEVTVKIVDKQALLSAISRFKDAIAFHRLKLFCPMHNPHIYVHNLG